MTGGGAAPGRFWGAGRKCRVLSRSEGSRVPGDGGGDGDGAVAANVTAVLGPIAPPASAAAGELRAGKR